MQKKVLSEIDLVFGPVKIVIIDRIKLKNDIVDSFLKEKRLSKNKKDYSYQDFEVYFSQPLQWLKDYIRDHFHEAYGKTLIPKKDWGNVYGPAESSYIRHQVDPSRLMDAPDYTCLYVVDAAPDSCELVIEYDNNRRKGNTWHMPIQNNDFFIFPSTQRYFISQNKSKHMNTFLTMTYGYL